jgi:hypothetical protein
MKVLVILAAAVMPLLASAGNIYRWVDASGQVHYSQEAPAARAEPAAPMIAQQSSSPNLDQLHDYAQKLDKEREQKDAAAAEAKQEKERKAERCRVAREQQASLQSRPRWYVPDGQGDKRPMTDDEHAATERKLQQNIDESCGR